MKRAFILPIRDDRVGELQRVAGGVADALDAIEGRHGMQQFGEVGDMAVRGFGYSENGVDSKNSSRLS